ncbi:ATP-dependent RNA helicase, partial [Massospora cicadina]
RRKRKNKPVGRNPQLTTSDESWIRTSIVEPPPIPLEPRGRATSNRSSFKPNRNPKREGKLVNIDELPWGLVKVPEGVFVSDDNGGFLGLEEIDGVDCEWVGDDSIGKYLTARIVKPDPVNGRKPPKKPIVEEPLSFEEMDGMGFIHVDDFSEEGSEVESRPKRPLVLRPEFSDSEEASEGVEDAPLDSGSEGSTQPKAVKEPAEAADEAFDFQCLSAQGRRRSNPPKVKRLAEAEDEFGILDGMGGSDQFNTDLQAIHKLGFQTPTPIQLEALPHALRYRDVIGCAETGSGKTLAFGLPLIHRLSALDLASPEHDRLHGLILTPTRELAIQIADHLKAVSQFLKIKADRDSGRGMSIQKQERLFSRIPHIMIATPGRLWELMTQSDEYMDRVRGVRYLVLDEADRMVERGHFKELEFILDHLDRPKAPNDPDEKGLRRRQTLVFSATLDNCSKARNNKRLRGKEPSTIADSFKDPKPLRIDLSSKKLTSENLVERRIDCVKEEKDLFLYFLTTRYPGRTLVFVNSIDTIRRLVPLLGLLGVAAFPLHAQMQQRQRLKNVDRFKALASCVLVASDVASRGLDIPGVEHIVHYQLPRTPDLYVHRSGRTARAQRPGISIMLCSPDERPLYSATCRALKRDTIPEFPLDPILVAKLSPRVALAREIDALQHRLNRESADRHWDIKTAELCDIELDDDYYRSSDSDEGSRSSVTNLRRQKLAALKSELQALLQTQVMPLGTSSYLTHGVHRQFVANLRAHHGPFRGVAASHAIEDAQKARRRRG